MQSPADEQDGDTLSRSADDGADREEDKARYNHRTVAEGSGESGDDGLEDGGGEHEGGTRPVRLDGRCFEVCGDGRDADGEGSHIEGGDEVEAQEASENADDVEFSALHGGV